MKKLKYLAMIGAMLVSVNGYSQGDVVFVNSSSSLVVNSLTGLPAVTGVLRVGLYYEPNLTAVPNPGAANDSYDQVGAFTAVGGLFGAGRFSGGNRTFTQSQVSADGSVLVQVRAWSAAFATYEEAYNAGLAGAPGVLVGMSNVVRMTPAPSPAPAPPLSGAGLQSFSVSPVPEPSMIALSILGGLGAMALLRRRK